MWKRSQRASGAIFSERVRGKTMAVQEEALIRRAASGDDGAFEKLVLAHQKQVYNLCLRLSGNEQDAYDLSQEAFIKAWRGLAQYQFGAEFSTWLYRLTRNVCIDHLRRLKRQPSVPLETEQDGETVELPLPDGAPGPEERVLHEEKQRILAEAMQALSDEQREILVLRVVNDLPYEQIAEILGLQLGTVKSRLARARIQLKKILAGGNHSDLFSSN